MKTELITTEILVPKKSRFHYTDADRKAFTDFKENMVKELGLPENWDSYFSFSTSDTFISLVEKGGYKVESFRKFMRSKKASYPADLKERLNNHIAYKNKRDKDQKERIEQQDYYRNLIEDVVRIFANDDLHIFYYKNSIEIELKETINYETWKYQNTLAKCTILHSGEITEPTFAAPSMRYTTTLPQLQKWIESNQSFKELILAKANEIKINLPHEYFIIESEPIQQ